MKPWERDFPPFRVFGNLYFAGTRVASTHIVDTGEGLIVFDSGYRQTLHMVIDGMYRLGLSPHDITHIFHTHGHIDHFGATRELARITGAKTLIGAPDAPCAAGEVDLSYAKELGMEYDEPFVPDVLLYDGDEITIGNTTVRCMLTPGHTQGATSFFFPVTNGEETVRAGLQGGMGMNSMRRAYLEEKGLPLSLRQDFLAAMDRMKAEPVDLFIGNHLGNNQAPEKYERLINGETRVFIDSKAWAEGAEKGKQDVLALLKEEGTSSK